RALWSQEKATYDGEFAKFKNIYCRPQPVNGSVPIIIGGHTKVAARRAGRLGDGWFPARGAAPELVALARKTAEENGRDPDALEITTSLPDDMDQIPALAAAGVNRILVPVTPMAGLATRISNPDDVKNWRDILDKYADL
ncbi:MAG: LLM class flavin-dependent oxidoreductase, partial [Rhodospirillaceae bacterium]|nr:LLM class flavin-dependent oxidoreductase [Rhodospirillaceae bacterium]